MVVDKARGGDHQKYNKELVVDFRILILAAKPVVFLSNEFESEKRDLVKVCEVDSDSEESALDEVICAKDRLTTRANGQFCKALTTMNTGRDVMRRATKYTDTVNADRTARIEVDALPSLIEDLAVEELNGSQRSDWEKVYCNIVKLQATSSKRFLKRMDTMEVITSFAIKACTLAENATLGSLNDFVAKCSALSELVIASIGSRSEPYDLRAQIADMAAACDKALKTGAQFGLDKIMKSDLYEAHDATVATLKKFAVAIVEHSNLISAMICKGDIKVTDAAVHELAEICHDEDVKKVSPANSGLEIMIREIWKRIFASILSAVLSLAAGLHGLMTSLASEAADNAYAKAVTSKMLHKDKACLEICSECLMAEIKYQKDGPSGFFVCNTCNLCVACA